MYMLGTLILAFGWFGFNPGSTLAGTDLNIGRIAANTMLASAAGALCHHLYCGSCSRSPTPVSCAMACCPAWWLSPPPAPMSPRGPRC